MFGFKMAIYIALGAVLAISGYYYLNVVDPLSATDIALRQFEDNSVVYRALNERHMWNGAAIVAGFGFMGLLGVAMFTGDIRRLGANRLAKLAIILGVASGATGCARKPFEPVKLEEIGNNEFAFMIPYTGDTTKQASVSNESYLKQNMVLAKQVRIPQQWVQLGYQYPWTWNGEYRDAAKLIKVDGSPVTREWTADAKSGTSDKNEAIWTMTSDQVEWSTGWTCTARIASESDGVKFLANYPSGSLQQVLDTEVRAKLQAVFGLAVTDLPMDKLRNDGAPVMKATIKEVTEFFQQRGITITNLGITGGYVYKNPTIADKMAEVFKAEQEKSIKKAETEAQVEENKRIQLEATAKADAVLAAAKGEADGIKAVADAKAYEIEKAQENLETYLSLKRLEIERDKIEKWNGEFPRQFLGGGNMNMLLQVPDVGGEKKN